MVGFSISMTEERQKRLDEFKDKRSFASRSEAIAYCIDKTLAMEKVERRGLEFLVDLLDTLEKHPGIKKDLKEFIKKQIKEMKNGE